MKYKDICFYNYFGNGDLFNSRGFVQYFMNKLPETNFYYAHPKNSRIFEDMENLKYSPIISNLMIGGKHLVIGQESDLYLNTWIGLDSRYVLPGIGCTLEKYFQLWKMLVRVSNLEIILEEDLNNYIPTIDYFKIKYTNNVNKFLSNLQFGKLVLISNGDVFSNQANNFDFSTIIDKLVKEYNDIVFIITQPINHNYINLFTTKDIIKSEDDIDLNEISYLSLFCDTIIGRSSGPYVFTQVKENFEDENKKFLSFTYHKNAANFLINVKTKAQKYWSNATNVEDVYNNIVEVLEK